MSEQLLYLRIRDRVDSALKRFGFSVEVTTVGGDTYKTLGIEDNSKKDNEQDTKEVTDSKTLYLQASSKHTLNPGDIITVKTENWAITAVKPINPGGSVVLLYEVEVAR